ncbi:MAG: hypothetical protein EBU90_14050 [Proteobacteria bacterium]|nr:hypothetical protein [Pseudomonadota bacterium]
MNDRIDELAEKAAEFANANEYAAVERRIWNNVFRNKFAELIIKECIERAKSVGDLRGATDDMIYGADMAAVQISKHFGVE